ncbi:MAG: hypothetical protein AB7N54_13040 [Alphaproteobacteria bacterium]
MTAKAALTAAAVGLDTIRTIQQGQAQAAQARHAAALGRQQAMAAREAAGAEAEAQRRTASARLAALRARGAGSGFASAGTPLLAALAAADDYAVEEAQIRAGGARRAAGLEAGADLDDWRAGTTERDTILGAGTSLLRFAGSRRIPTGGTQRQQSAPRNPWSFQP